MSSNKTKSGFYSHHDSSATMCGLALPHFCRSRKSAGDCTPPSLQWAEDMILKQGFCQKRAVSAVFFQTWKERHIVLRPSRITWHEASGCESLGELLLGPRTSVAVDHSQPRTFVVTSGSRALMVLTSSDLELHKWVLSISDVISGWQAPHYPLCTAPLFRSKYHKGGRIGCGGFGEVFKAQRISDSKMFAVKVISRSKMLEMGLSLREVGSVKWEVKILMDIDHHSIAKMEDYFSEDGSILLVFELCKGGDLFNRLKQHGAYTEAKAKIVARRILEAIAFCHSRNIIHRDIKLENIVLSSRTDETDVRLIDFGLARPPENRRPQMTCAGTKGNFAPEMIDKEQVGYYDKICPEKVDVWQFGIIVYATLSARHPFRCKGNPLKECHRILDGNFEMSSDRWRKNISEKAKAFIRCALTVNAIKRPSAEELLQHPWLEESK
jgi:serine/threonine protein kinase